MGKMLRYGMDLWVGWVLDGVGCVTKKVLDG